MGYALAGIATGATSGYKSSIVYITIYAVMNLGAFGCIYLMRRKQFFERLLFSIIIL